MQVQRTIPILLDSCPELDATVVEFARYCSDISVACFNGGSPLKALELHSEVYRTARTPLSAQMKCSAIRRVAGAYSARKRGRRPISRPFVFQRPSALFLIGSRGRDASIKGDEISICTVSGRRKVKFRIPEFARADFDNAVMRDAIQVGLGGKASLCLTLEVPDPVGGIPVGVDVGIRNLVVASVEGNPEPFVAEGGLLEQRNRRTRKTRARLQSKLAGKKAQRRSTRSVRRALKRLSRKHRNRNRTTARQVAARLCEWAPPDSVLVFEDLRIRPATRRSPVRKGTRRKLNQWFYRQLIDAATHKAERLGIAVDFVDPAYSSQNCSRCGCRGNRRVQWFDCPSCGFHCDADENAAINHRQTYAVLRGGGHPSACPEARDASPRASSRL